MRHVVRIVGGQAVDNSSTFQSKWNRFLTRRPEMISAKDNLVGWTVVPEVPLATGGLLASTGGLGAFLGPCRLTTFCFF